MAYDKKKLYKQAIKVVEKHELFFIEEIVSYLPCDKTTFYRLFPVGSNEYNALRDMLDTNRVHTKVGIRAEWRKSGTEKERTQLYRLASTKEEHRLLSQHYVESKTIETRKEIPKINVIIKKNE